MRNIFKTFFSKSSKHCFFILFLCLFTIAFQNCSDEPAEALSITDNDNDGIEDSKDNCAFISNPNHEDDDNDGLGNVCNNKDSEVALAYCENGFADIFPCNDYDLTA